MPKSLAAEYLARIEAGLAERKTSSGRAECLCARLVLEGRLSQSQFQASAKFREAHHKASRGAKLTHAWPKAMAGRLQPAYRTSETETTSRHRLAYERLLAVLGPHLAIAALTIAVHDRAPREYGREVFQYRHVHAAAAAGLVSLIHALDILADHLGIEQS